MKRFLFLLSIILVISVAINAQSKNVFTLSQFSFEDTAGKNFKLDTLKGNVVFIDCWFPACPPCRAEMPYSKLLQNRLHTLQMDSNIVFVTISFKQSKDEWLTALKTLPMPSAIHLYSPASTYEMALAGGNYPTYKIFNVKGELDNETCPLPSEIGFIDFVLFAAQKGIELEYQANKTRKFGSSPIWLLFEGKPEKIALKYMPNNDDALFKGLTNPKVNLNLKILAKRA